MGLEQIFHKKRWSKQQFTFICFVGEANAIYSRDRVRKAIPEP